MRQKVIGKQEEEEEEEEEGEGRGGEERSEVSESSEGMDGVFSRLDELQLGMQEPELSEEQLRINDELQEYEVINIYLI